MKVFCLTIDTRPIVVAPNLAKLLSNIENVILNNYRFQPFDTIQRLPSYPAVSAGVRRTGEYSTVIYLNGVYSAMFYINKIDVVE